MWHKAVDQIGPADIESLVRDQVREGHHLDYKEVFPPGGDDARKDLLADVVSFANAGGGDLVIGVSELREGGKTTGLPDKIVGVPRASVDKELGAIEQAIQAGIAPRVVFKSQVVDMGTGVAVVVLRVLPSWSGPHMVSFKHSSRFFSRNSTGKIQLDVHQIRSAFAASESVNQRVAQFRAERVAKILGNETMARLGDKPTCVLHVISLSGQGPNTPKVELPRDLEDGRKVWPPEADSRGARWNLDGFCAYSNGDVDQRYSCIQVFRDGAIEGAWTLFSPNQRIAVIPLERGLVEHSRNYFGLLRSLGVEGPLVVAVSLLNVKNFQFRFENAWPDQGVSKYTIDRAVVLLPELVLEEAPTARNLRPLFDLLWQAAGYPQSQSYNEKGDYTR